MTKTFANKPIEVLCKCGQCNSHTLSDRINKRCYCCDLEDMLAILTNYNAMEVQKNRQGLCIMIMIICNYNSIIPEQAQRELLLLLKCFSSLEPHVSCIYSLLTFILSNMIFFYEERLLQQSRDGAQLLVWVYCS